MASIYSLNFRGVTGMCLEVKINNLDLIPICAEWEWNICLHEKSHMMQNGGRYSIHATFGMASKSSENKNIIKHGPYLQRNTPVTA